MFGRRSRRTLSGNQLGCESVILKPNVAADKASCSGAWIQQPKVASHWDLLGCGTKASDHTAVSIS